MTLCTTEHPVARGVVPSEHGPATPEAHSHVWPLVSVFGTHLQGRMTLPSQHPWTESLGSAPSTGGCGHHTCWVRCELLVLYPPWVFSGPQPPSSGCGGPRHASLGAGMGHSSSEFSSHAPSPVPLPWAGVSPVQCALGSGPILGRPSDN